MKENKMWIQDPIIIIGAPRSGTTFLKELLCFHKELWYLPQESHHILEGPLHPKHFKSFSNRPDPQFKLSDEQIEKLQQQFWQEAINLSAVPGGTYIQSKFRSNRYTRKASLYMLGQLSKRYKPREKGIRFLEKTPKNSVRLPVIQQIFPDAKFLYITRDPIGNINSILRGWHTKTGFLYKIIKGKPRFASSGYKIDELHTLKLSDGFKEKYWRFVLPPGWQEQEFKDLVDIAIYQYQKSNELARRDLKEYVAPDRIIQVQYVDLVRDKKSIVKQLLNFTGLSAEHYDFNSLDEMPKINQSGNKETFDIDNYEIERRLS